MGVYLTVCGPAPLRTWFCCLCWGTRQQVSSPFCIKRKNYMYLEEGMRTSTPIFASKPNYLEQLS